MQMAEITEVLVHFTEAVQVPNAHGNIPLRAGAYHSCRRPAKFSRNFIFSISRNLAKISRKHAHFDSPVKRHVFSESNFRKVEEDGERGYGKGREEEGEG